MSQYQGQRTPYEVANSILRSLTATAKGEVSSLFMSLLTTGEPQITPAPNFLEGPKTLSAALTGLAGICDGEAKLLTVPGTWGSQCRGKAPLNFPNAWRESQSSSKPGGTGYGVTLPPSIPHCICNELTAKSFKSHRRNRRGR
jgi:hypothetical protein